MVGLDVQGVDGALDGEVAIVLVQDDDVLVGDTLVVAGHEDRSGRLPAAEGGRPGEGQGEDSEDQGDLHFEMIPLRNSGTRSRRRARCDLELCC